MQFLNPPDWPRPKGYSNGVSARGRMVFTAGVIGWDEREEIRSDALADQVHQALTNIVAVLRAGDAAPEHVVRMTWYVTDVEEYRASLKEIGAAYRAVMGAHFPAMAVVQVVRLVEARAKVEIEATAVVPD
ncbi:RidA family protein [Azospirillum sp.]|uniref:RidA family protein n=1 Tax=Azospirillum sp. TaxID=34012 RepID=UPI002D4929F1|nr:RidA family protein [Azospirillum sp.]HYD66294.1 RidA family protein [Azospirillum sp.]